MPTKPPDSKVTVTWKSIPQLQALFPQRITIKPLRFVLLILGLLLIGSLLAACSGEAGSAPAENATLDPVAAEGQSLFKQNCASCHAVTGETIIVGPSLAGIATRAATRVEGQSANDYILMSILRPDAYIVEGFSDLMPTNFGTTLSGEELDAIMAYLMTLVAVRK